tara:strand:+ start:123 stop:569 length:447 start_codon:yes stop_codon:yes gene_type:complete
MKIKIKNNWFSFKVTILFCAILIFYFLNFKMINAHEVSLPNFGFSCKDTKKTNKKFEFIFSRNKNDTEDIVFRRINGKFEYIGSVLAKKQGSYVLWEDKIFFRTSDFAWTIDKVTSILTPLILSVGNKLEDFNKIPEKMTCHSGSIYY